MNHDELKNLTAKFTKDPNGLNVPQYPNLQVMKGLVNTPQFMGVDEGIEAIRTFIRNQKRAKGFEFPIVSGSNPDLDINISGTARMLLGFSATQTESSPGNVAKGVNLTINNEVILDNVNLDKFGPLFTDDEFYFYPRPLSGQYTWQFNIQGQVDNTVFWTVYYI